MKCLHALCRIYVKICNLFSCDSCSKEVYVTHMHTQPSLNEVPEPAPASTSSQTPPPSSEGGERKRPAPADGDENIDPDDKLPRAKQPRTIEIDLPPSNTNQDTTGKMCVRL